MYPTVPSLGAATRPSPYRSARYMSDETRVLRDPHLGAGTGVQDETADVAWAEQAGPRARIYFDPTGLRCGVLTAGGLCPGINDVIRGIVLELHYGYGVESIVGLRYGFDGLRAGNLDRAVPLTPGAVAPFHGLGGTLLGTARGRHEASELARSVEALGLGILFCIGGDGTLKGAAALDAELRRRGVPCAVVALPKTIDNDILQCGRTFGFMTSVEEATRSIAGAHAEATAHEWGVGLVKLMGRDSGFIAASATLACPDVNFCLVPEVPFELDGEAGLLQQLRRRLERKGHAVIVVAEGAGSGLVSDPRPRSDASGNVRPADIGSFLAARIARTFHEASLPLTLKYLDPSYAIRSRGPNATDKIFCGHLAKMAVHAGMAGKTGVMIGLWHDMFVHVPLATCTGGRRRLKPAGLLWQSVLASTGQPSLTNA